MVTENNAPFSCGNNCAEFQHIQIGRKCQIALFSNRKVVNFQGFESLWQSHFFSLAILLILVLYELCLIFWNPAEFSVMTICIKQYIHNKYAQLGNPSSAAKQDRHNVDDNSFNVQTLTDLCDGINARNTTQRHTFFYKLSQQ